MKQLHFVVLFITSFALHAQDSTIVFNQFYKRQQVAMGILGSWATANLAISPILRSQLMKAGEPKSSMEYFHELNFYWNVVNAGIAGIGFYGVHKRKKQYWFLSSIEKERKKLIKTLAVNMGLDVNYILVGALLKKRSVKMSHDKQIRMMGFGNSFILQGAFLLVFDGVFVFRLKN